MSSSKTARRKRRATRHKQDIKAAASIVAEEKGELTLRATVSFDPDSLVASAGEEEKLPTFTLTAYNGGKMKPSGWRYPTVVQLSGVEHDGRVPVFLDHEVSGKGLVGHATVAIDGKSITAAGIVSADTESSRLVVSSAKRGFPWQVSIGADPTVKTFVRDGASKTINGVKHDGPFIHVAKCRLHEMSFVPIGADSSTSAAIAAQQRSLDMAEEDKVEGQNQETPPTQQEKKPDKKFVRWIEAQGFDYEDMGEEQLHKLKMAYDVSKREASEAADEDVVSNMRTVTASEIDRQSKIRNITRFDTDLQIKAIAEGWTPEYTELELLRKEYQRRPQSTTGSRRAMNLQPRAIEAAICNQVGVDMDWLNANHKHWRQHGLTMKGYSEQELDAATDLGEYTFGRLMHEFLYANGVSVAPGTTMNELIPKVKQTHRQLQASTGFSTVSIAGIMSNVLNKTLLAAFDSVDQVAQRISASRSVSDFKETKAYRLTGNGDFLEVGGSGELQNMQLQEEEFANRAKTYGRMLTVTRQQLINDDLGALTGVTTILGRKAALKIQSVFFTAFDALQDGTFFSATRGNSITDVLGLTGLTAAELAFLTLEDADGDPISVMPSTLLVPPSLKVTAEVLMNGTTTIMVAPGAAGSTQPEYLTNPSVNPHVGKWNIEMSPWLESQGLTNSSSTRWFLLGPPSVVAPMEIVYLNNRRVPAIESEDSDFQTLGFMWRAYLDFGVAQRDWRGAVYSTGAGS